MMFFLTLISLPDCIIAIRSSRDIHTHLIYFLLQEAVQVTDQSENLIAIWLLGKITDQGN